MRAAVFRHRLPGWQQARCRRAPDGVGCLRDQGRGLRTTRLLRHCGIGYELRQPAARAQPHLQRVDRIGSALAAAWEIVTRRLQPKVQHDLTVVASARSAVVLNHNVLLPRRLAPPGSSPVRLIVP